MWIFHTFHRLLELKKLDSPRMTMRNNIKQNVGTKSRMQDKLTHIQGPISDSINGEVVKKESQGKNKTNRAM